MGKKLIVSHLVTFSQSSSTLQGPPRRVKGLAISFSLLISFVSKVNK